MRVCHFDDVQADKQTFIDHGTMLSCVSVYPLPTLLKRSGAESWSHGSMLKTTLDPAPLLMIQTYSTAT
jgi:hypothetical protein